MNEEAGKSLRSQNFRDSLILSRRIEVGKQFEKFFEEFVSREIFLVFVVDTPDSAATERTHFT